MIDIKEFENTVDTIGEVEPLLIGPGIEPLSTCCTNCPQSDTCKMETFYGEAGGKWSGQWIGYWGQVPE